ncbi:MAG: diiron oxygenase [Deltaproteobacteria bacterium]|nr:diiron oxygenase [Deltaproteobacteria bacterium]
MLTRGLLEFTRTLPPGAPEFRYAYHEVIEEGQHSLMFQEFVNRAGLPVHGLTGFNAFASRFVPRLGATFPELFFLFVLAGEAPIDDVQRRALSNRNLHPLLRRVMQIHVTEEARHLCFARSYLKEHVPALGAVRRFQLGVRIPFVLSVMAEAMMKPPTSLIQHYGIPRAVVAEAYGSELHRAQVIESLSPIRSLARELGLLHGGFGTLWRGLGIAPALPALAPRRLPAPGVVRALPSEWLRGSAEAAE